MKKLALVMSFVFAAVFLPVTSLPAYGDEIVSWWNENTVPPNPPGGDDFTAISAGYGHSFAFRSNGSIVGWGKNDYGQTTLPVGYNFIALSAGLKYSLGLTSTGRIVGWGKNDDYGQATSPEPPEGEHFTAISAGRWHSLGLTSTGRVVGWGRNDYGQATPPEPPEGDHFIAVDAGWGNHSLGLTSAGRIVGWGYKGYGLATPPEPPEGESFIAVSAGNIHSLALTSDGRLVAWGSNDMGETTVPEGNDFITIDAGMHWNIALRSDGSIVSWGDNRWGQTEYPAGNNFTAIAAGAHQGFALRSVLQNTPPVADAGGPYLVAIEQSIMLDGSGSHDPDGDGLTYVWNQYQDLGDFDDVTLENPTFTGVTAGVTELELWVDDGVEVAIDNAVLVVYDPEGGFVTGGGWIDSPAGAYAVDPLLSGKANFGFVSKYKKGATVPTGQTEFVFQAGDLNFHSSSYQWLVVNQAGTNAQFKGVGTINGAGDYKFMLWAGDDLPDTFRIKIWTEDSEGNEMDIYDNGFDQPIGGGSIVVHAK
jgi:hypothetical protein